MDEFLRIMRYSGGIRGVVFDWAGTIVDYGCFSPAGVFLDVFREEGVDVSVEEARQPMGVHKKTHIRQMVESGAVAARWLAAKGARSTDEDIERMYKRFTPLQEKSVRQYSSLIPGFLKVVDQLRMEGVKIGTCTGFSRSILDILVEEAKQQGFTADCNIAADQVDDTAAGILEGINAGCWTIGVSKTGNYVGLSEKEVSTTDSAELRNKCRAAAIKLRESGAHFVVESVAEVPDVIHEVNTMLKFGMQP